jgi:hypothetical protein
MNNSFREGDVVICGSGQAGSLVQEGSDVWVLLTNGDIWTGPENRIRHPQDQADLDAAPLEVEKIVVRNIIQR